MSGGVDSSVAALLLKKRGFEVTGVFMKNWSDPLSSQCIWKQDLKDFKRVCKILKISSRVALFEDEYRDTIVDYLIRGYQKGITPNPDMLCNREIKFKLFMDYAKQMGADGIATGHYVRKKEVLVKSNKTWELHKARDLSKDQSYFLALLNQKQIRDSFFPIGDITKNEVRRLARDAGLPVYDKKDSQGICFVGPVKFQKFIRDFIPPKKGPIQLEDGTRIGSHSGAWYYTIGQRRGLGIGGGKPYYVVDKDVKRNIITATINPKGKTLNKKNLTIGSVNWIGSISIPPGFPCRARIRYRQPLQTCRVSKKGNNYRVTFKQSQRAASPGQFLVMYRRSRMLGGGVIV